MISSSRPDGSDRRRQGSRYQTQRPAGGDHPPPGGWGPPPQPPRQSAGAGRVLLTHLQMGNDEEATIEAVRARFDGPVELVEPGFRAVDGHHEPAAIRKEVRKQMRPLLTSRIERCRLDGRAPRGGNARQGAALARGEQDRAIATPRSANAG